MGIKDKLSSGLGRMTQEAEKAVEQGRYKVGELQTERQMDQTARRLGYLEYDANKAGESVDQQRKQELLDEMKDLEKEIEKARKETEARKEAVEEKHAETDAETDAEKATGMDETAIGPEEVTGVELPEQGEERLKKH